MSNISDDIEKYLIELFSEGDNLSISRNDLATLFSVVPSQINYVLTTRFTPSRGFIVESRRGGGGYISIVRVSQSNKDYLIDLSRADVLKGITYNDAFRLLQRMVDDKTLTESEAQLINVMIADKAIIAPAISKNSIRASMLKNLALELLKREDSNV